MIYSFRFIGLECDIDSISCLHTLTALSESIIDTSVKVLFKQFRIWENSIYVL